MKNQLLTHFLWIDIIYFLFCVLYLFTQASKLWNFETVFSKTLGLTIKSLFVRFSNFSICDLKIDRESRTVLADLLMLNHFQSDSPPSTGSQIAYFSNVLIRALLLIAYPMFIWVQKVLGWCFRGKLLKKVFFDLNFWAILLSRTLSLC